MSAFSGKADMDGEPVRMAPGHGLETVHDRCLERALRERLERPIDRTTEVERHTS